MGRRFVAKRGSPLSTTGKETEFTASSHLHSKKEKRGGGMLTSSTSHQNKERGMVND